MKEALMSYGFIAVSIAATIVCWGVYGPILHWGQSGMENSRLRPLICVGLAYFVIGVIVPMVLIYVLGQEKNISWSVQGIIWSSAAGAAGALGALGIIMAFNFGGKPIYVMPLVFGCAPVVNTFWTMYWNKTWKDINPFFAAGLILVAVGAATVLIFQPKPAKPHAAKPVVETKAPLDNKAADEKETQPAKETT